jgi:hypothetical protein
VEALEPRVCLALLLPFQAANVTFGGVVSPSGNNLRSVNLASPPDYEFDLASLEYDPNGHRGGVMGWPQERFHIKTGTSEDVGVGHAISGIQFSVDVQYGGHGDTPDSFLAQALAEAQSNGATVTRGPTDADVTWTIQGGGLAGKGVTLHGRSAVTRSEELSSNLLQAEGSALASVFPAGYLPNGWTVFYVVSVLVQTAVSTDNPRVLPKQEAIDKLLGMGSLKQYNELQIGKVEADLSFTGAIPDTLFLYDFSHESTLPFGEVLYLNQYEQASLPVRYGVRSGNACGPSSLVAALFEVGIGATILDVYNNTMTSGVPDPARPGELSQEFDWIKGERYAAGKLAPSFGAVFRDKDTWQSIDANLEAGAPVLLGTWFGEGTARGSGHVMLLLGVGKNPVVKDGLQQLYGGTGDYYIVADPAGHYFGDATHGGRDVGHYGVTDKLRALGKGINYGGQFAIYPKSELVNWSKMRTLTLKPSIPAAKVGVHSPVSVVVIDPLGRKSGITAGGTVLAEIPEAGYQVAVSEEFGAAGETYSPDEEKGVVILRPVNGTYQVQLVGTGTGPYRLDIDLLLPGVGPVTTTYSGAVTPGEVKNYTFVFPPSTAPTVTQVYLSGSAWAPSFRSYIATNGLGTARCGFALPAEADQLNEQPWANVNQVSISFSTDVQVDAADLSVRGVKVASYALDPAAFAYDAATRTATWELAGNVVFGNDRVLLDLNADGPTGVRTGAGVFLDGDWINPDGAAAGGDAYPSGDGTPGGDFRFAVNVLPGDTNRNGAVLADDFSGVKKKFFKTTASAPVADATLDYSPYHDVDGSGSILAADFSEVKRRFFNTLPPGSPAPAATALSRRQDSRATDLVRS